MERRKFVVATMAFYAAIKSIFAKSTPSMGKLSKNVLSLEGLTLDDKTIYLTSSMVVELPKNPSPIDAIYEFSVARYRMGKSPVILTNGEKLNGVDATQINVKKDLRLTSSPVFYLQYTGKDLGWIFLH